MNVPPKTRFERQDPPEIAALKRLRQEQPDLALAVDMQMAIVTLAAPDSGTAEHTVDHARGRVDRRTHRGRSAAAPVRRRGVRLDGIAGALQADGGRACCGSRFSKPSDHATLMTLARDSHPTPDEVRGWFEARLRREHLTGWVCPQGDAFQQVLGPVRQAVRRARGRSVAGADRPGRLEPALLPALRGRPRDGLTRHRRRPPPALRRLRHVCGGSMRGRCPSCESSATAPSGVVRQPGRSVSPARVQQL